MQNQNTHVNLVCKSFDEQYKRIQAFRNQYLNMVRLLLKQKNNNISIETILSYNEIENKITNLFNDIKIITQNLKLKKNNNDMENNTQSNYEADFKMIQTLMAFIPFMIIYYNSIPQNNKNNKNNQNNQNNSVHIDDIDFKTYNEEMLRQVPLD